MKKILFGAALLASFSAFANEPIIPDVVLPPVDPVCCAKSAYLTYFDGKHIYNGAATVSICKDSRDGSSSGDLLNEACREAQNMAVTEAQRNLMTNIANGNYTQ